MSRIKDFWYSENLRKVLIWVGVVYMLVATGTIVWQQYHYYKIQGGYHKETIQILDEHTDTLNEVKQLRLEVTNLVKEYGPDLTAGQKQIVAEYSWIACALNNGPSKCGTVPP